MPKRKQEPQEYICNVVYTEGCSKRLTDALADIYYKRKMGIGKQEESTEEKPA